MKIGECQVSDLEKEVAELKVQLSEVMGRLKKLENVVKPKNVKWTEDENKFLLSLCINTSLKIDDVTNRTMKWLHMVQAFQQHYERTERSLKMRLESQYF